MTPRLFSRQVADVVTIAFAAILAAGNASGGDDLFALGGKMIDAIMKKQTDYY